MRAPDPPALSLVERDVERMVRQSGRGRRCRDSNPRIVPTEVVWRGTVERRVHEHGLTRAVVVRSHAHRVNRERQSDEAVHPGFGVRDVRIRDALRVRLVDRAVGVDSCRRTRSCRSDLSTLLALTSAIFAPAGRPRKRIDARGRVRDHRTGDALDRSVGLDGPASVIRHMRLPTLRALARAGRSRSTLRAGRASKTSQAARATHRATEVARRQRLVLHVEASDRAVLDLLAGDQDRGCRDSRPAERNEEREHRDGHRRRHASEHFSQDDPPSVAISRRVCGDRRTDRLTEYLRRSREVVRRMSLLRASEVSSAGCARAG